MRLAMPLTPEKARAFELGAKWESADQRLGATAALFRHYQAQCADQRPAERGLLGRRRRGAQPGAGAGRGRPPERDHWRLNASLVFNDVEITRDNTLEVGGRLLNVPQA